MTGKKLNKKKILVTGGAGFIGSHLAEELLKRGEGVFILDNLSTGSIKNIKHLLANKNLVFKKGSVLNKKYLAPLIRKSDQIYHLAAAVGVKHIMENPLGSLINNIDGTKNVLEAASRKKIPVLVASSSEAYGKNEKLPFREDGDRVYGSSYSERWGYALSKTLDEFLALSFWKEKGLPTVTIRFFNTIGPRQTGRYGMVVPRFIEQALKDKPLTVYGDGRQARCFCYVGDIVQLMIKLLNNKKAYGEIFNAGSEESITINALAGKIKKIAKSSSPIIKIPYHQAYLGNFEDMRYRVPDISKIKKLVNYQPTKSLDQLLELLVKHHQG